MEEYLRWLFLFIWVGFSCDYNPPERKAEQPPQELSRAALCTSNPSETVSSSVGLLSTSARAADSQHYESVPMWWTCCPSVSLACSTGHEMEQKRGDHKGDHLRDCRKPWKSGRHCPLGSSRKPEACL